MADPITAGLMVAGTALTAHSQAKAGRRAQRVAEAQALELEYGAGQKKAESQRTALEVERQGKLEASRALAVAAASGGGASDPTIINLMAQLAGETNYRKMVALYEGEAESEAMMKEAKVVREEGRAARKASQLQAFGTVLSGGSSMYSKFGGGGPSSSSQPMQYRA